MKRVIRRVIGIVIVLGLAAFVAIHYINKKGDAPESKEPVFESITVTYDGTYHTLEVANLKDGMRVDYEVGEQMSTKFKDVGVYKFYAIVFDKGTFYGEYEATLEIVPKKVIVKASDLIINENGEQELTIEYNGLIPGDDLNGHIYYDKNYNPKYECNNPNYEAILVGGLYKASQVLVDGVDNYTPSFTYFKHLSNKLFPVTFRNKTYFENRMITEIKFVMLNAFQYYDEEKLEFVVYIVDQDLKTKKEDCTIANGKKIVIDAKEAILNNYEGLVTLKDLNIYVGEGETLVFGDEEMLFGIGCYEGEGDEALLRSVFTSPLGSVYSLPITVKGYWYFGGEK